MIFKGLVRPAKGFVQEGNRTKRAEFGYPVTKFISSNARGSRYRFVERISFTMTVHQIDISVRFVRLTFLNTFKTIPRDETDIAGQEADSPDKK